MAIATAIRLAAEGFMHVPIAVLICNAIALVLLCFGVSSGSWAARLGILAVLCGTGLWIASDRGIDIEDDFAERTFFDE
jgi:hypothetical protein